MKKISIMVVSMAAGVVTVTCLSYRRVSPEREYRTYRSPDGRFKIVVYWKRRFLSSMPGQTGDSPGEVCLFSVGSGKVLERKSVDMVQNIDEVAWSRTNVDIKLFADWKLPK